jgi:hypothetical protein
MSRKQIRTGRPMNRRPTPDFTGTLGAEVLFGMDPRGG